MDLFGPALGAVKARNLLILWLRGVDLNHRPLGYEPNIATLSGSEFIQVAPTNGTHTSVSSPVLDPSWTQLLNLNRRKSLPIPLHWTSGHFSDYCHISGLRYGLFLRGVCCPTLSSVAPTLRTPLGPGRQKH